MSTDSHLILTVLLLFSFVTLTWFGPRWLGLIGLIGVQLVVWLGYCVITVSAMDAGRYQYEGIDSMIGLTLQAILLNGLLLPVGLLALWRRRRAAATLAPR